MLSGMAVIVAAPKFFRIHALGNVVESCFDIRHPQGSTGIFMDAKKPGSERLYRASHIEDRNKLAANRIQKTTDQ